MQVKLIFTRKVVHLASFESEGFWNSEVAYSERTPSIKRTKSGPEINVSYFPFIINPYSADTSIKRTLTLEINLFG